MQIFFLVHWGLLWFYLVLFSMMNFTQAILRNSVTSMVYISIALLVCISSRQTQKGKSSGLSNRLKFVLVWVRGEWDLRAWDLKEEYGALFLRGKAMQMPSLFLQYSDLL